ncbi:MAG: hypothetical protein ACFHX7_20835 [Pseudomonadota bacterium]
MAVLIAFGVIAFRANLERKKHQSQIESFVSEVFAGQPCIPEVKSQFVYGTPCFSMRFRTEADKDQAISNGLTDHFTKLVQTAYGHLKVRGESFDAVQAIAIFSLEDEDRWEKEAAAIKADRDGKRRT